MKNNWYIRFGELHFWGWLILFLSPPLIYGVLCKRWTIIIPDEHANAQKFSVRPQLWFYRIKAIQQLWILAVCFMNTIWFHDLHFRAMVIACVVEWTWFDENKWNQYQTKSQNVYFKRVAICVTLIFRIVYSAIQFFDQIRWKSSQRSHSRTKFSTAWRPLKVIKHQSIETPLSKWIGVKTNIN